MKYAIVCAAGPIEEVVDLAEYDQEDTVYIGVDRGALYLLEKGIQPNEAVGDFDSVTEEQFKQINSNVEIIHRANEDKDETDTELAVQRALAYQPDYIILTGVTGGRLDHLQSALHLLYRMQAGNPKVKFKIHNTTNDIRVMLPGVRRVKKDSRFPYTSFFSFGPIVTGLTLTGFKYETVNERLEMGVTRFTSNETVADVCTISFREGICLMVRSSDS
ncbi:thiamine diphosphokinase [Sporosarcina ureae]|uniref:Thiamine diphosphokinase n=1 Tax=Sporosarcina ureae TaxID=1571 RepID=A0ABM6JYH0_SPOUR|nr:thiamine diphosphokinase [Sporosarcina ureae]ARF15282.1 thiamine pyrophosphokinase [Sporosarcina ureae]